jgi:phosphomannomutase
VSVIDDARAWIEQDPDAATRAELEALIAADDTAALEERFAGRLEFGTAGLRGELGAGPLRMNRVLVGQAAGGLASYLLQNAAPGVAPSIVIGFDGRTNSHVFARDTAELMAGAGIRTLLMPRLLPTPVLAFAVRHLGASAGVMVTASHNPARDNGYKVYLGGADGGSQIVPPADALIATEIGRITDIRRLPRATDYERVPESTIDAYVAAAAAAGSIAGSPHAVRTEPAIAADEADDADAVANTNTTAADADTRPRFVYTAMHGVGLETATRVFSAAGFREPIVVAEQAEPDPAFPTVAFPNPEEPGALDLSIALAEASDADLVIANDPDADRLAVAIPEHGVWRRLSGNEVGALLGWAAGRRLRGTGAALAASVVSSPALREIAESFDLPYVQTLTGFKWISRAPGLGFGYEEALGYLVNPDTVRDKDGISAAAAFLALTTELSERGQTLVDHQRDFDATFGAFASAQISLRVSELADIPRMMARLRADTPDHIGRLRVLALDDFATGLDGLPTNDILRFRLEHGARVIVRPSGTEPKLKVYIDASSTVGEVDERRRAAREAVDELERGMRDLL